MTSFEVLWSGRPDTFFPHKEEFSKHNNVTQYSCAGQGDGQIHWRNNDRQLRDWFKVYGSVVSASHLLWMEWDVYCNTRIKLVAKDNEIVCAGVKTFRDRWMWLRETKRLLPEMRDPYGIVPLGFCFFPIQFLKDICDPRFDDLFNRDVFCELRMGSLVKKLRYNFKIMKLPNVKYLPLKLPLNGTGVFHPVKEKIILTS